jgi:hypothetical protein
MMPQTEMSIYSGSGLFLRPNPDPGGGTGGGGKRPSKPAKKATPKKSAGKAKSGAKRR